MKPDKKLRITGFVLLGILILVYANHFNNGFHFDDSHTVEDNVAIRKISNIPAFFTNPDMFSNSPNHKWLRPVVTTSLAVDYWLAGGLYPFAFQLSTFLWHILLCVLLFLTYRKLLAASMQHKWVPYIALFAAAWFGFHTAIAETVNYIISRSDVLSTTFIAASFYIYIAFPQKRKWFLYMVPAILAVLTKETVISLLAILFFYILFFEKNLSVRAVFQKRNFRTVLRIFYTLLPMILILAALQVYTLSKISAASRDYGMSNPAGYYWLTQTYVWFLYFKSFFLPLHLSADTDLPVITSIFDGRILTGLAFVVLLVIAIFRCSKKKETRPVALGLIWFAASLLPTSVSPMAEVMNDHRMYFAFTGLSLSVVTALALLVLKGAKQGSSVRISPRVAGVLCCLILGLNAYGVYKRNQVWKTEESLWKDVTEKSPGNGRGWMNYGLALMGRGNYEEAMRNFKKAQELTPAYSTLFINMGIASGGMSRDADARNYFNTAIQLAPAEFTPYAFYARYLLQIGALQEAKANAEKALSLNANSMIALDAAMGAYQALGLWSDLGRTAAHVLLVNPGDPEAQLFLEASKTKKTVSPASSAMPATLESAEDYLNLSLVYYNAGAFDQCIETCKKALALKPAYADAYSNMGAAYNSLGQWDKGKAACEQALAIDPHHKLAAGNLQWSINKHQ
ncbi:tetratricopeptide repeat protein [Niabella hirudinis]|uniref:tetratricopeptide repeat protein n=1 Tax=Niabella hirudinis TaxID=1285929 RepID=UPI003EBA76E6